MRIPSLMALAALLFQAAMAAAQPSTLTIWPSRDDDRCVKALAGRVPIRSLKEAVGVVRRALDLDRLDIPAFVQDVENRLKAAPDFRSAFAVLSELQGLQQIVRTHHEVGVFPANDFRVLIGATDFVGSLLHLRSRLADHERHAILATLEELHEVPREPIDSKHYKFLEAMNFRLISTFFRPKAAEWLVKEFIGAMHFKFLDQMQTAYIYGPYIPIVNRSAMSALSNLQPETEARVTEYLRQMIREGRMQTYSAYAEGDSMGEMNGSIKRRNAEVLLNFVRRKDLLSLANELRAGAPMGKSVERTWLARNGEASEVSFDWIVRAAKRIQRTLREVNEEDDVLWVGSFPNGRGVRQESDFDLIFGTIRARRLENAFYSTGHAQLIFKEPRNEVGLQEQKIWLSMVSDLNGMLGELSTKPTVGSLPLDRAIAKMRDPQRRHALLYQSGGLNQFISIRIGREKIYLELFDALTYTSHSFPVE